MWRMSFRKISSFSRDDRGLQLVELAITLPVLILLFAAVAEFGRYFQSYTTLSKGTRVAARYLATASADGSDDLAAKNLVVYGNVAGSGSPIVDGLVIGNVHIDRQLVLNGSTVTVEIQDFKHTPIFDIGQLTKSSLSLNVDMKASATMRYLLTQPI